NLEWLVPRRGAHDALLYMEKITRLVGEADDPFGKLNATCCVVDELRSPDIGEFARDRRMPDHIPYSAGYQIELQMDLGMLFADEFAQPAKKRSDAIVQR